MMTKTEYRIAARHFGVPTNKPFRDMTDAERAAVRTLLDVTGYRFRSPAAFVERMRQRLDPAAIAAREARQGRAEAAALERHQRRLDAMQRARAFAVDRGFC